MPRRTPRQAQRRLKPRGVYIADWVGPNGEFVLFSINSKHQKVREVVVPFSANHVQAGDDLWAELDDSDPIPDLKII